MKGAWLGAKFWPLPTHHAVVPFTGAPAASTQRKAAPPHDWTSMPRWVLYQAPSATGSFARKKIPPMPVTRFMVTPMRGFSQRWYCSPARGGHGVWAGGIRARRQRPSRLSARAADPGARLGPLDRGLDVLEVLQGGLPHNALEEEAHRDRHQAGAEALGLGSV